MKRAAVSGASGAIGGAIAGALAADGYEVFALGRRADKLAELAARTPVRPLEIDLESPEGPQKAASALGARLDLLVHAAGTYEQSTFADGDEDALARLWSIHVDAPWRLTRALLPALIAARGEVAFVNSSVRPDLGLGPYAAAKAAQRALADSLRAEVNVHRVRVVSLFPGRTAGELQERLFRAEEREYVAERLLQPADVARALLGALALARTAECTDLHLRPLAP
jgi:NADP-dependent 3-hydroxy acid dehydrogenase YdfG